MLLQSCGVPPPPQEAPPDATLEMRQRLVPDVTVGNVQRTSFDVTWATHRERDDIIRGYNVYVATESGMTELPDDSPELKSALFGGTSYPGDTDGDIRTEAIRIDNVTTATRYYVHVRTVFGDGSLGHPSNEVEVVPRPRGELTICPLTGNCEDGFSFRLDEPVDRISVDNDFYIFQTKTDIVIASPARIDRNLRKTLFVDLGPSESLDDYPHLERDLGGEEKLTVREGRSIGLILNGKRIAKLRPIEIDHSADNPHVVFEYMFQPFVGELTF